MTQDRVFELPIIEKKTEHISLRKLDELAVIVVDHPRVRAAVAVQGAHLFAWQPTGHQPVLWLSDASLFREGTAVRGGVPVCWPWFGPVSRPSHGFARISDFEVVSLTEDGEGVDLRFALRSDDRTRALWPHDFVLAVGFRLGEEAEITLEAQGDFESTGALHSYLHVGDIDGVSVEGLGVPFLDQVTGEAREQDGPLTFPDRTDNVYTAPRPVSLVDQPALRRTIEIHHHGNTDVVAWNPGPELSHSMADLTDDGYRGFACVETARVSKPMTSTHDDPAVLAVTMKIWGK